MLKKILRKIGSGNETVLDYETLDFTSEEWEDLEAVAPFTMPSPARIFTLSLCIEHLIRYNISGDIVKWS